MSPRVGLLALGGTVSCERDTGGAGAVPRLNAAGLLASVDPDIANLVEIVEANTPPCASAALTEADIVATAHTVADRFAAGVDGVVVTVGTDTLEEVAFGLDVLIGDRGWIVVTGAMRPASAASADGPANVAAAIRVAAAPLEGTVVVMGDQIYNAHTATKLHTSSPSAFGGHGAHVGDVTESRVIYYSHPMRTPYRLDPATIAQPAHVALVTAHLGDDGSLLTQLPALGYQAAVYETMGGGHVHPSCVERLAALSAQMPVVLTSRTGSGAVLSETYAFEGSEVDLAARTSCYVPTGPLSGSKARLLLSLQLGAKVTMADALWFRPLNAEVGTSPRHLSSGF